MPSCCRLTTEHKHCLTSSVSNFTLSRAYFYRPEITSSLAERHQNSLKERKETFHVSLILGWICTRLLWGFSYAESIVESYFICLSSYMNPLKLDLIYPKLTCILKSSSFIRILIWGTWWRTLIWKIQGNHVFPSAQLQIKWCQRLHPLRRN